MNLGVQRSDELLYQLMKKGDREAFAELYERREPALYRFALHMTGGAASAEEIAHEVFVQLMAANTRFDEARGSLEGWMYGVARNLIRVHRRKNANAAPANLPEPVFLSNVLGALIDREAVTALHAAIRELPDGYREAVVLCDLEERNYEEAARLAGCPVGTIRSRLHRARGLLAGKLRRLKTPAGVR